MTTTVAQMTKEELREMIQAIVETVIEQKLAEIFSDPDEGLELRETVRDSLLLQKKSSCRRRTRATL